MKKTAMAIDTNDQSISFNRDHRGVRIIGNPLWTSAQFNALKELKTNQTERKREMTTLMEKYNELNNGSNKTVVNPLQARIEAKKGIAQETVDLSIQKFVMVETLQKSINALQSVITSQGNHISSIDKDMISVCNAIKALQTVQAENNALLINIAKKINGIVSAQTVTVKKADSSNPEKTITANTHTTVITADNDYDYEALFQSFMKNFNSPFCKTKAMTPSSLIEFQGLINGIDFTSADTISESVSAYWTQQRTERNFYMWGAPQQKQAIAALIAMANSPVNNSKVNAPVKDKAYWLNHYAIDSATLDEFIDMGKSIPIKEEEVKLIKKHLATVANRHATHETDGFINWLKAFYNGK